MGDDSKPPIKVGDILNLAVEKIGNKGTPMMRYKDYVIFLKDPQGHGFLLNKLMEIKVIKLFPRYAFAERTLN